MENNKENNINLGGFPPIFFENINKQKREFKKKNNEDINMPSIKNLNILNIKNILNVKK